MKKLIFLLLLLPVIFINYSCKDSSTEPIDDDTDTVNVRKPNLYIYPDQTLFLTINVSFPRGGKLVESIPEYNNLWEIAVEPNGQINGLYDYLYYECTVPEFAQLEFGWVIKKQELEGFFEDNLTTSGFSEKEVNDFIEYWIPILIDYEYYEIYPQYKSVLEKVIDIRFSKEPDNFFRLCYVIIGRNDNNVQLKIPIAEKANRSGYFAVEWGVILK